jgi:tetratricopeptide (TPR) repeat protein
MTDKESEPKTEKQGPAQPPEPQQETKGEPKEREPETQPKPDDLLDAARNAIASGRHHMTHDERDVARGHFEQALSIMTEIGNQPGIARATFELGILSSLQAEYGLAQQHYQRALAIWQELEDRVGQADALTQLGHACYRRGDTVQAQAYYVRAHETSASADDQT